MLRIVDHFAENQDTFIAAAGPGHWNDPDMVRMVTNLAFYCTVCYMMLIKRITD